MGNSEEKKEEIGLPEGVYENKRCDYRVANRNCYGDRFAYCLNYGVKCKYKTYAKDAEGNTYEYCKKAF